VCQRADKAGQEMEETLSEEWVRLTDERAQLQEWQDTLLEKTNEAFAQTRVGRTMLHQ
jgi:phage terminase Nu1 subunit (DNA packaging protein)